MRVAVVGGGFAGLALCWHLLQRRVFVDLYEQEGIGAGASGVSSGLLHPYAGEQVRRSFQATEAIEETKKLLWLAQNFSKEKVADFSGVLRRVSPKQLATFFSHAKTYQDVQILSEEEVFISSGITVHSKAYLLGLYEACLQKGLSLHLSKIDSFQALESYDYFFLALGFGIFSFSGLPKMHLSKVKGQTLICKWPFSPLQKPILGKGHIVPLSNEQKVHLGATYERSFQDSSPCIESALSLLKPQARQLYPAWKEIEVFECRSGVRIVRPGYAVPWIHKVHEKGWALTAMGSRGLLYHAYYAKQLVDMEIGRASCRERV